MRFTDRVYKAFRLLLNQDDEFRSSPTGVVGGLSHGDYRDALTKADQSSIVMACITWIAQAVNSTDIIARDADDEPLEDTPLLNLLARPNPATSQSQLRTSTLISYLLEGYAYWLKVYTRGGELVELWQLANDRVEPRVSAGEITHYLYQQPSGRKERLEVEDVVHFKRLAGSSSNVQGVSPLAALVPEIWTDANATAFTTHLLKQMGVAGMVITIKDRKMTPQEIQDTRKYIREEYTGKKRGSPLVLAGEIDTEQMGFKPQELFLPALHNFAEERVCAVYGVPAAVIGFGTGLQQTRVGATLAEQERQAWQNAVIPVQVDYVDAIMHSLALDFPEIADYFVEFDLSNVRVLQEDELKRAQTISEQLTSGRITVAEAREAEGYPVEAWHDVFLRPLNLIETPNDGSFAPALPDNQQDDAAPSETPPDADSEEANDNPTIETRALSDAHWKRVTLQARTLAAAFRRSEEAPRERFVNDLMEGFDDLGRRAEEAYLQLADQFDDELITRAGMIEVKQEEELIRELTESVDIPEWTALYMRRAYNTFYLSILRATVNDIETVLGAAVNIPDPVQRTILDRGGTRLALLDVQKELRESVLDTVAAQRATGAGIDETARRIRSAVPAGRFTNAGSEYRAQLIARTEARYAQNWSSLEASRVIEGANRVLMLDAQLGDTDEICEQRNGRIVTFDEARRHIEEEHGNGTLDIIPHFG